jgi:hypothetical protein
VHDELLTKFIRFLEEVVKLGADAFRRHESVPSWNGVIALEGEYAEFPQLDPNVIRR